MAAAENKTPLIALGCGAVILLLVLVIWRSRSAGDSGGGGQTTQSYYSVDDGKSYFADDITRGYSFERNGQLAVQAEVYSCNNGSTRFVAFLRRVKPSAQPRASAATGATIGPAMIEVKKPGDATWTPMMSPAGAAIQQVHCPGGNGVPTPVEP